MQRSARGIDIQRAFALAEESLNPDVGLARIDARAAARVASETITDGVLDAQRDELEAPERTLLRRDIDPDRLPRQEPEWPRRLQCQTIDVVLAGIGRPRDPPEDAGGNPRVEVGAVADRPFAAEMHPAGNRFQLTGAGRQQVVGQQLFQAAWATGKESFHRHSPLQARKA